MSELDRLEQAKFRAADRRHRAETRAGGVDRHELYSAQEGERAAAAAYIKEADRIANQESRRDRELREAREAQAADARATRDEEINAAYGMLRARSNSQDPGAVVAQASLKELVLAAEGLVIIDKKLSNEANSPQSSTSESARKNVRGEILNLLKSIKTEIIVRKIVARLK